MSNKVFLYGERKVGKTTIINELLSRLCIVGGIAEQSAERRAGIDATGTFIACGFKTVSDSASVKGNWELYLTDINDKEVRASEQNRVACCKSDGTWEAFSNVFDSVGVELLSFDVGPEIIIMDEIGFMEKEALHFQNRILEILDGPYPVLGVIKPVADPFLQKIYDHPSVRTIEVTAENRDKVFDELLSLFNPRRYSRSCAAGTSR